MTDTTSESGTGWTAMTAEQAATVGKLLIAGSAKISSYAIPIEGSDDIEYLPSIKLGGQFWAYNPPGGVPGYAKTYALGMNAKVVEEGALSEQDWFGRTIEVPRFKLGIPTAV
jgi:hypothetical protein